MQAQLEELRAALAVETRRADETSAALAAEKRQANDARAAVSAITGLAEGAFGRLKEAGEATAELRSARSDLRTAESRAAAAEKATLAANAAAERASASAASEVEQLRGRLQAETAAWGRMGTLAAATARAL